MIAWVSAAAAVVTIAVSLYQGREEHELRASPLTYTWVGDKAQVQMLIANAGNRTEAVASTAFFVTSESDRRAGASGVDRGPLVLKAGDAVLLTLPVEVDRAAMIRARTLSERDSMVVFSVRVITVGAEGGQVDNWVPVAVRRIGAQANEIGRLNATVRLKL